MLLEWRQIWKSFSDLDLRILFCPHWFKMETAWYYLRKSIFFLLYINKIFKFFFKDWISAAELTTGAFRFFVMVLRMFTISIIFYKGNFRFIAFIWEIWPMRIYIWELIYIWFLNIRPIWLECLTEKMLTFSFNFEILQLWGKFQTAMMSCLRFILDYLFQWLLEGLNCESLAYEVVT